MRRRDDDLVLDRAAGAHDLGHGRGLRDRRPRAGRPRQRLRRRERCAQEDVARRIGGIDAEQDVDLGGGGAAGAEPEADEERQQRCAGRLEGGGHGNAPDSGRARRDKPPKLTATSPANRGKRECRAEISSRVLPLRHSRRTVGPKKKRPARCRQRPGAAIETNRFSRSSPERRSSRLRAGRAARRSSAWPAITLFTCSTDCTVLPLIASSTSPATMPARSAAPSTSSTTRPASIFASRFSSRVSGLSVRPSGAVLAGVAGVGDLLAFLLRAAELGLDRALGAVAPDLQLDALARRRHADQARERRPSEAPARR